MRLFLLQFWDVPCFAVTRNLPHLRFVRLDNLLELSKLRERGLEAPTDDIHHNASAARTAWRD